jgi:hypothetical protein
VSAGARAEIAAPLQDPCEEMTQAQKDLVKSIALRDAFFFLTPQVVPLRASGRLISKRCGYFSLITSTEEQNASKRKYERI